MARQPRTIFSWVSSDCRGARSLIPAMRWAGLAHADDGNVTSLLVVGRLFLQSRGQRTPEGRVLFLAPGFVGSGEFLHLLRMFLGKVIALADVLGKINQARL